MASSNPFRKSAAITVDSASFPNSTSSAASRFPALDQIETASTPPPPTSFQQAGSSTIDSKSNITKKVRVLSPPPLSPDSPEWAFAAPSIAQQTANQRNEDDPFDATSTDDSDREMVAAAARGYAPNGGQGIGNPFSKTLRSVDSPVAEQKLEHERKEEGHALKAANTARRSLDVNAFKRLLMTGNTEDISPPENALQEASLISEEASDTPEDDIDQENVSDSSASAQLSSKNSKKPPPPPSSRHGKSIKLDLVGQASREPLATLSSDMNKPLPPAPVRRSMEEGGESPFDREAAGKVPEAEGDVGLASPEPSGGSRKAVPAPPPRRGHARGESKVYASGLGLTQQQFVHNEENLSRTSTTATKISSHLKTVDADTIGGGLKPHGSEPIVIISGSIPGCRYEHYFHAITAASILHGRVNTTERYAIRNTSARDDNEILGSTTTTCAKHICSTACEYQNQVAEEEPDNVAATVGSGPTSPQSANEPGKSVDILADLDALQREVDALRGKLG
ncbi:hypothetical protein FOC4_g10004557 [Fusarium odoratissimum]|uniref:Uncharacterized protein n=1 Tax=Fusarium oxysporum f. sp. cubense (strain race 4) TaxID=2502994 RepID=N1S927_FUSC4|nr:hypothetical protein FOC4_g10004557 [Fusarium odoratissimum]